MFWLVSEAEETGLSVALSETTGTGFVIIYLADMITQVYHARIQKVLSEGVQF